MRQPTKYFKWSPLMKFRSDEDGVADLVPTLDQDEPVATYRDWRPEDTRVITYRIGNSIYPGVFAESREDAIKLCEIVYGRVLEANYVPGRAFLRVRKRGC